MLIWHELGHWLNDRCSHIAAAKRDFAEGVADTFAMYQMGYPHLQYHTFMRSGINTFDYEGDCDSQHPFFGRRYQSAQVLSGAFWRILERLEANHANADKIADALFLGWMNAFNQKRIHNGHPVPVAGTG